MIERLHPEENRFDLNSEDLVSETLNIDSLREEVKEIREQELAGNLKSAHLTSDRFDPDELSKEDLVMWHKFKSGNLSLEELQDYQKQLKTHNSSAIFAGMIANKLAGQMLKRWVEKAKNEKDGSDS